MLTLSGPMELLFLLCFDNNNNIYLRFDSQCI